MKKKSTTPAIATRTYGHSRVRESRQDSRDAIGALPSADDRVALETMKQFDTPIRRKLLYPSTVRTTLVREFRMPWHWMWALHYKFEDPNANPARWAADVDNVLTKYAIWTGLLELCPGADVVFHIFLKLRTETDPRCVLI